MLQVASNLDMLDIWLMSQLADCHCVKLQQNPKVTVMKVTVKITKNVRSGFLSCLQSPPIQAAYRVQLYRTVYIILFLMRIFHILAFKKTLSKFPTRRKFFLISFSYLRHTKMKNFQILQFFQKFSALQPFS